MFARSFLALATAALLGCASTAVEEWEPVEETRFVAEDGAFSLELPAGWRRSGELLTREGPELQTITFNAGDVLEGNEVGVDLAAPELLQAMKEMLSTQPDVKVLELGPATLDGLPAFRMHFTREVPLDPAAPAGPRAKREALIYGAVEGHTLYALSFEAADGVRFALDLAAFERLVASFARRKAP